MQVVKWDFSGAKEQFGEIHDAKLTHVDGKTGTRVLPRESRIITKPWLLLDNTHLTGCTPGQHA